MRTVKLSDVEADLLAELLADFTSELADGNVIHSQWDKDDASDVGQLDSLELRLTGEDSDDDYLVPKDRTTYRSDALNRNVTIPEDAHLDDMGD